jgi:hypothetical protein
VILYSFSTLEGWKEKEFQSIINWKRNKDRPQRDRTEFEGRCIKQDRTQCRNVGSKDSTIGNVGEWTPVVK